MPGQWIEQYDPSSGFNYYYNAETGESSWDKPADFVEGVENDECKASLKIQSIFRGRKARRKAHEKKKNEWIEQYDPSSNQKYYYNTETGESQWEVPPNFVAGGTDDKLRAALLIQTTYRAKKARSRVSDLKNEGSSNNTSVTIDRKNEKVPASKEQEIESDTIAELSKPTEGHESNSPQEALNPWVRQFDPNSQAYYFYNVDTAESQWEEPKGFVKGRTDHSLICVTRIQCAYRSRKARKRALEKKQQREKSSMKSSHAEGTKEQGNPVSQSPIAIISSNETPQQETESTQHEDPRNEKKLRVQQEKLQELIKSKKQILFALNGMKLKDEERTKFGQQAADHQQLMAQNEKLMDTINAIKQDFDAGRAIGEMTLRLSRASKECSELQSHIDTLETQFLPIEAFRLNNAWKILHRIKDMSICKERYYEFRHVVNQDRLQHLISKVDSYLRRAMGLTGFSTGTASILNKKHSEWHEQVKTVLLALEDLENELAKNFGKVEMEKQMKAQRVERKSMAKEEDRQRKLENQAKATILSEQAEKRMIQQAQEAWRKGLVLRESDYEQQKKTAQLEQENDKTKIQDRRKMLDNFRAMSGHKKDRIWQDIAEGCTIPALEKLMEEESTRFGQESTRFFRIHDAHPETGKTLIQIATWWGHTHLVQYFIQKGVNFRKCDSLCNRFTLLHDAARAGHPQVIKLLLSHGLSPDLRDGCGDTPLHWAVRKGHVKAVITLLDCDEKETEGMTPMWRSIATKNQRGRVPSQLAKNMHIQRILNDYEEKLPVRIKQEEALRKKNEKVSNSKLKFFKRISHREGKRRVQEKMDTHNNIQEEELSFIGGPHEDAECMKQSVPKETESPTENVELKSRRQKELNRRRLASRVVRKMIPGEQKSEKELAKTYAQIWKGKKSK